VAIRRQFVLLEQIATAHSKTGSVDYFILAEALSFYSSRLV
jgi:hypothetical protein